MPAAFDSELIPLREAFKPLLGGDRRYEKNLYYRHPDVWSPGTPEEKPNSRAGWIIWAGNNRDRAADMMERGFVPLRKFGLCARYSRDEEKAQGTPDQYGPWGAILMHPEGPAAFPIDQIKTYRWYDPRHCPVPGTVFPQLDGAEISEYACPDCNDRVFAMALHLSRHLRAQHEWTVNDVVEFGKAMGLDFSREFNKAVKTSQTYTAGKDERPHTAGTPVVAAPVVITQIVPSRSEVVPVDDTGTPDPYHTGTYTTKPAAKGWTPERRAEASRKAKERMNKGAE